MKGVKNWLNAPAFEKNHEVNDQPSMTVPDKAMSVREIMTRYSRGLPLEGQKVPIYEGEEFMPDPRYMDLADRQELQEQAEEQIKKIKNAQKQQEAAKKQLDGVGSVATVPTPTNTTAPPDPS